MVLHKATTFPSFSLISKGVNVFIKVKNYTFLKKKKKLNISINKHESVDF